MNVQLEVENKSEKKQIILETMLDLIDEHGLQGVPMSLLAKKASVAAGTIYHYFESKEAMILELFFYTRDRIDHEIFKMKDRSTDEYGSRFKSLWIHLCLYYIEHPKVLSFLDQFFSSPFHKRIRVEETQLYESNFASFLQQGIEMGKIKNHGMQIIIPVFYGALVIAAKKQVDQPDTFSLSDLETMAQVIWDGLKV